MGNLTHTVSGDIASFRSAARVPIESLKCYFKPKQDLHGYSKPWPAGGGKNLFNWNVSEQNPDDTTTTNTTARIFTPNTYCVGTSWSNWWQPNQIVSYSISNGTITVQNNNVYGIGFAFKLAAETTYVIGATATNGGVNVAYYDNTGTYITTTSTNIINNSFTTPADADITILTFYTTNTSTSAVFTNIQLEKGSSKTSYEPYENICPIEGWDSCEIYRTQNLWDGQYEVGYINSSGQEITGSSTRRSVGYIPVKPSSQIQIIYTKHPNNTYNIQIFQYKSDKTYNNRSTWIVPNGTYNIHADTAYIRFTMDANYTSIYTKGNLVIFYPSQKTTIPITFPILGKNKFNYNNANIINNKRLDDTGKEVTDASGSYCKTLIPVIPNTTYTLSGYTENNVSKRIYYIDKNQNFISRGTAFGGNSYTFITPDNCYYCQIQNREIANAGWETLQLELGDTATKYESYNPDNTVYGGYIDIAAGEIVFTYYKYTLNGTETNWSLDGSGSSTRRTYIDTARLGPVAKAKGILYCNYCHHQSGKWYGWISSTGTYSSCHILFYVPATIDTIDKWKTYLNENPLEVCYELNLPIHYPLSKTELKTFLDQNNIWSNTNDITEVSYQIHDSNMIQSIRKEILNGSAPHLESVTGDIVNFNTDMAAKLKQCKVEFNPVQKGSGDPSPSNVRPITGWTGVNVQYTGKNIFDKDNPIVLNAYIDNNKNIVSSSVSKCIVVKVNGSTQYTVTKSAGTRFAVGDSPNELPAVGEQTLSVISDQTGTSITITTNTNAKSLIIWCHLSTSDTLTFEQMIATLQVEQSAASTIYNQYTGTTISITFPTFGKNLLNPATLEQGGIAYNGPVFNASNRVRTGFIPVEAGEKYTVSATGFIAFMHFYDAEKGNIGENVGGVNITAPEGAKFVRCGFRKSDDADIVPSDITDGQLEEGSTATSYEPYTNTIYGGYVDLVTGEVWNTWWQNHKEITTTDGSIDNKGYRRIAWNLASAHKCDGDLRSQAVCNIALYGNNGTNYFNLSTVSAYLYLSGDDTNAYSVDIYYPSQTPYIIATLTPTQLKALRGTNNIWSNANGNIEIKYWTH